MPLTGIDSGYKKYLLPQVIAKLSNLELIAKLVVEGFITGLHKSPYHGFSVEFTEHRQYMPGDDLRHLDWKVFARTDRHYIKQYEEETNLKSYILLDVSKSMSYTSDKKNISKLDYASYLASSLSYLMKMQNDAVSLTTYDTQIRKYVPPHSTNTNLKQILKVLSNIESKYETGTAKCLNEIAEKIRRRGLVIVISDFFDKPEEILNALKHFRYGKNEVIIFQILDPAEMNFFGGSAVTLVDSETKEEIYAQPFMIQKSYKEAMKEYVSYLRTQCVRNNIDYVLIETGTPFDISLLSYLSKRKKLK